MNNQILSILTVALLLISSGATASVPRTECQQKAKMALTSKALHGASVGFLAVRSNGDTLLCINHKQRMAPASNLKLITTGAALRRLGPSFRFETKLAVCGNVNDGVLDGDLYIVGGGDPTTAALNRGVMPRDTLFSRWAKILRENGIRKINGRVIADPRFFEGEGRPSNWTLDDIGYDYGARVQGLNFYENKIKFSINPGLRVGDSLIVRMLYPEMPWMNLIMTATTSEKGKGNETYYDVSRLSPVAHLGGTCSLGSSTLIECKSNEFGPFTCAWNFAGYLEGHGVEVSGGCADVWDNGMLRVPQITDEKAAEDLTVIGSTYSQTMVQIVREANHESNNFYTEALFRMLGKEFAGSSRFPVCVELQKNYLVSLGFRKSDFRIVDGCGLSRKNSVSADFMVGFLRKMMGTGVYGTYLVSLPRSGEGTLKHTLSSADAATRHRIRMKTGTMDGIRCLSGYILPSRPDGETIAFSLLVSNATSSSGSINKVLEEILLCLAAEN